MATGHVIGDPVKLFHNSPTLGKRRTRSLRPQKRTHTEEVTRSKQPIENQQSPRHTRFDFLFYRQRRGASAADTQIVCCRHAVSLDWQWLAPVLSWSGKRALDSTLRASRSLQ